MSREGIHSWRKVPYGTRPAKHAERKMLVEALARLNFLHPLPEWRYVGLGSLWFTDFALFHRRLGIQHLHSIEGETDPEMQTRFERNAPFSTQLHFGWTTSELPRIPWDRPAIIWLDYDDIFRDWMFQDVSHIVSACRAPTVLLISLNVSPGDQDNRRQGLAARVGSEDRLPKWARRDTDLGGERRARGMANAVREMLTDQINDALSDRGESDLRYQQIFHFRYADGASMLTFGGLVSYEEDPGSHFSNLPYYKATDEAFCIEVPILTMREGLALEALLPTFSSDAARLLGITSREIDQFRLLYRYLPSFVDADI